MRLTSASSRKVFGVEISYTSTEGSRFSSRVMPAYSLRLRGNIILFLNAAFFLGHKSQGHHAPSPEALLKQQANVSPYPHEGKTIISEAFNCVTG